MASTGTHSDGKPVAAFCVRRASGEVLAERLADEAFYAASTVKLAVLAAVARAVESGDVTLDTMLVSTDTFTSLVPGAPAYRIVPDDIDAGMPPPGSSMSLAATVDRMVVVSSNEATNMVTEVVGLPAVAKALADAGATSSSYDSMYSDFAAAAAGATRLTTARDLAALMSALVLGDLADGERTAWMTSLLARQTDRLLTVSVPDDVPFGSKSGWVDGIRHDVAFIGEPGPRALVVAVCTRGYEPPAAEEAIRAIGALALSLTRPG